MGGSERVVDWREVREQGEGRPQVSGLDGRGRFSFPRCRFWVSPRHVRCDPRRPQRAIEKALDPRPRGQARDGGRERPPQGQDAAG